MISKLLSVTPYPALFDSFTEWLGHNRLTIYTIAILLSIGVCLYGLTAVVDAACEYSIAKRQRALHTHSQQLEQLVKQVEELQAAVKEREGKLTQIYEQVLKREGRLVNEHIVPGNVSRLVAIERGPAPRAAVSVSRSFSRYSPYQFDVTMPSAITAHELESIFANTPLQGLGRSFIQAELRYGINAVFLAALAIHESHWGNSALAHYKNNMFGFGAYDSDPFSYAEAFRSKHDCILYVAKFIQDNYINGQYNSGRNIADINRHYASDEEWSHKVFRLMLQMDNHIQEMSAV